MAYCTSCVCTCERVPLGGVWSVRGNLCPLGSGEQYSSLQWDAGGLDEQRAHQLGGGGIANQNPAPNHH